MFAPDGPANDAVPPAVMVVGHVIGVCDVQSFTQLIVHGGGDVTDPLQPAEVQPVKVSVTVPVYVPATVGEMHCVVAVKLPGPVHEYVKWVGSVSPVAPSGHRHNWPPPPEQISETQSVPDGHVP